MARSSKSSTPPPGAPSLKVLPAEAAEKIEAQVGEGERLLATSPNSDDELDALREQRRIWSDYNRELLMQLFTTSAVAEEYSDFVGGSFSVSPSFEERVGYVHDDVRTSLTRLRSIHRRLELFPAPTAAAAARPTTRSADTRKVFLVHGHNEEAKETVARFLERLDLDVVVLHEKPDQGRTIIEKFEDHATVSYAVVLLTADDVGADRDIPTELQPRARQNVVLELGYFLGALGRAHVCALREEGVEVPSDLAGVLYVPLDAAGAWKFRVAGEIKAAGLDVDMNLAV